MRSNRLIRKASALGLAVFCASVGLGLANAEELGGLTVTTTLSGNRFDPAELAVPAGRTFQLVVVNNDRMVEQFQSADLRVEKLVPGGKSVTLRLGPFGPGTYRFAGAYHPETAQGRLVAR